VYDLSLSPSLTFDDAPGLEIGEWEVLGDARVETRFRFRTGITSVAPWLPLSGSSRSWPVRLTNGGLFNSCVPSADIASRTKIYGVAYEARGTTMAVDIDLTPTQERQDPVGISEAPDAETAAREAVLGALAGRVPTEHDLVVLFVTADYDVPTLYQAAVAVASPAAVVGCSGTDGLTHHGHVAAGCVAVVLPGDKRSFGVCHVARDEGDIAGSARRATEIARERAGEVHPHSVVLLLTDGLTPDQREAARGAYEVTGALIPFVGGAAGDSLQWERTYTFGDGAVRENGILAVWINSQAPIAVSVGHGWRPAGKPMLVTRTGGTVVHELDGKPAVDAYLAELSRELKADDPEFFLKVLENPVGIPNARGRYDVRQLHAYLPEGGGLNFNTGISEHSILQVMNCDDESLLEGARDAAESASAQLGSAARLALVFSCGSRVPLLADRVADEASAISAGLAGAAVCGFYTYGEFARVNGSTGVHNSSVAILAL